MEYNFKTLAMFLAYQETLNTPRHLIDRVPTEEEFYDTFSETFEIFSDLSYEDYLRNKEEVERSIDQ